MKKERITQTRIKITWFGAIVFAIVSILGVLYKMEQVAITAIGGITFVITGYQASEGYTKAKFIQKTKDVEEINH